MNASFVTAVSVLLLAGSASAQVALYSNAGPADPANPGLATGSVSASGAGAPGGSQWSEAGATSVSNANAIAGFSTHAVAQSSAYRFADDFTVSSPNGWRINSATFFAYQTGNAGVPGSSPFASLNVRIWSGRPGDVGSVVLFGDTATNRLSDTQPLPLLRIFNSASTPLPAMPDATRVIWANTATLPSVVLPQGTYWIDWQYAMTSATSEGFSPPVTVVGARAKVGGNAVQLKFAGGEWVPATDTGKPFFAADVVQDLPFLLSGTVVCPVDFNDDGILSPDDLDEFITVYFSEPPERDAADFNVDGIVSPDDLDEFITAYFNGCS